MAVLTREQLMEAIRTQIGDDTSDSALSLIENITDTVNDYETRANTDGTDWKKKYEDNDNEWRKKYRERFFSGTPAGSTEEPEDNPKKLTFDELFKEV